MPKNIFLKTSQDFIKFEEVLQSLCEKYLTSDWKWSFRVGGVVQKEISEKDPHNDCFRVLKMAMKEDPDAKHETPVRMNLQERFIRTGERFRTPAAPPPPPRVMSNEALKALGKTTWDVVRLQGELEERFFLLNRNEFERKELLQARKEIWDWAVTCVEGEDKDLFCYHVIRGTDKWDVNHLHTRLQKFLNSESFRDFGCRIGTFFTMGPHKNEDIFSYMGRVEKEVEGVEKLNHIAVQLGESVVIPNCMKVWKILMALDKYPEYRSYQEKIQLMAPEEWLKLKPEMVQEELHKVHSNKMQMKPTEFEKNEVGFRVQHAQQNTQERNIVGVRRPPPPPPMIARGGGRVRERQERELNARPSTPIRQDVLQKLSSVNCPPGTCLGFFRTGECPRQRLGKKCYFNHGRVQGEEKKREQNFDRAVSRSPIRSQSPYKNVECNICGLQHNDACRWRQKCFECGGIHAARVCEVRRKRESLGRPRSNSY